LIPGIMSRVSRAAGDEGVEPVVCELQIRTREDEVVAAGSDGTSRAEAVEQEQRQCSDSPPRQSLEPCGPHHTSRRRVRDFALAEPIVDSLFRNADISIRMCCRMEL